MGVSCQRYLQIGSHMELAIVFETTKSLFDIESETDNDIHIMPGELLLKWLGEQSPFPQTTPVAVENGWKSTLQIKERNHSIITASKHRKALYLKIILINMAFKTKTLGRTY